MFAINFGVIRVYSFSHMTTLCGMIRTHLLIKKVRYSAFNLKGEDKLISQCFVNLHN